ncbi:MAG TPA: hypothetical protein PLZ32_09595 [Saprospiraceae bacterium]|nr:hypothetical protein [Saprospiraceae bacterium]
MHNNYNKLQNNKDTFLHPTLTFLMFAFCGVTGFSQVTKQQLDNYYETNQIKELEQTFSYLHNKTKAEFVNRTKNDTLSKINELFNMIIPDKGNSENVNYFFLQQYFPSIFIDKKRWVFKGDFIASTNSELLKPILFDPTLRTEILEFIGPDPYETALVKNYLKDKDKMRKAKLKKAEKLINDYESKSKFISQFLEIPATWGKMDISLVPHKITSLKFNTDLTEAEITYDLTSHGATEIYNLVDGKWKQKATIMRWIH